MISAPGRSCVTVVDFGRRQLVGTRAVGLDRAIRSLGPEGPRKKRQTRTPPFAGGRARSSALPQGMVHGA